MADSGIRFNLSTADGRTIDAFQRLVDVRRQELGSTTKDTCIALVINALKSLRSNTAVAKKNGSDINVENVDDRYRAGFKMVGRKTFPVIRNTKGDEVKPDCKVVWISKNAKTRKLHVFSVEERRSIDKVYRYLVVSTSQTAANKWIKDRRTKRIEKHRGLAKAALGWAMKKIHDENVQDDINMRTAHLADANTETIVQDTGFDIGNVRISVHDKLGYAVSALKGGPAYVETAVQLALNKMTAMIIHRLHGADMDTSLRIPFEELKK